MGVEIEVSAGPTVNLDVQVVIGDGAGGGVSDHGALTGLGDDDHSLYALADGTRGTFETSGAVATHAADSTSVHGIGDTADLIVEGDSRLTDARTPTTHTHPQSDVTNLTSDLAAKVASTRTITAGTGLTGGGDLSADRTLSIGTHDHTHRAIASGTNWWSPTASQSGGNSGLANQRLYYVPFVVDRSVTLAGIGAYHSVNAVSGAVLRVGVYDAASNDGPGTLLFEAGSTIDLSTAVAFKSVSVSQAMTPGLYYLACVAQFSGGTQPNLTWGYPPIPSPAYFTTTPTVGCMFEGSVSGAMPSTATTTPSYATPPPMLFYKRS